MATASSVKSQIERSNGAPARREKSIAELLASPGMVEQMQRAIPAGVNLSRLMRLALTELRKSPKLMVCTQASVLGAIMNCAALGLEFGPMEQAYLVPFRNKVPGTRNEYRDEATLIVGYKGYLHLARNSGMIEDITARVVFDGDIFRVVYGDEDRIVHEPAFETDDPQLITHSYMIARTVGGGRIRETLTREQIEKRRKRSATQRDNPSGPWVSDYAAMARKSAIRAGRHYLPMSTTMADAFASDERVTHWEPGKETIEIDVPLTPDELAAGDFDDADQADRDAQQAPPGGAAQDATPPPPGAPQADRASEPDKSSEPAEDSASGKPLQGEELGPLTGEQEQTLKAQGITGKVRGDLVQLVTAHRGADKPIRSPRALTAGERNQLMRAASHIQQGDVAIRHNRDNEPELVATDPDSTPVNIYEIG